MEMSPRLDVLPESQGRLWPELATTPAEFVLYGGTAVALHLGHRNSIDFDFFAHRDVDSDKLLVSVPYLIGASVLQVATNTLTCVIDRKGPVKISFFGVPRLHRVRAPLVCADNGLKVASLLDLAATKISVVQKRAEAKDFVDIDAILRLTNITISMAVAAAAHVYSDTFNAQNSLKALTYFGDGNLDEVPADVRARIVSAVKDVDLSHLPELDVE